MVVIAARDDDALVSALWGERKGTGFVAALPLGAVLGAVLSAFLALVVGVSGRKVAVFGTVAGQLKHRGRSH